MTRMEIPLNQSWLFCREHDQSHNAQECDEQNFETVHLPHTNQPLPYSGFDDRLYQRVCSYRKHFTLPPQAAERRVHVRFEGAMAAARVFVNGHEAGEHKGGYTPFELDITPWVQTASPAGHVLAVELDSHERPEIPPFGGQIDYLTYGGLYREVSLKILSPLHVERLFVKPRGILEGHPRLELSATLKNEGTKGATVQARVQILDASGQALLLQAPQREVTVENGQAQIDVSLEDVSSLSLWNLDHPVLYTARLELLEDDQLLDVYSTRFGLREARFTPEGFNLNGRVFHLRGLNRHQSYPWVGYAMPPRVQRRDADILKHELHCNIVRTSHYPQSPHFLDRCDEIGLLVLEEIPGWQHIGQGEWKEIACRNVEEMIERDFNHPSIVLWGVRINESPDDGPFYQRTNAIAHDLDGTRQTGGIRCNYDSNLLEDVFTYNDFDVTHIRPAREPLHLITEYAGHMFPTKHADNVAHVTRHTALHAQVQSQAAQEPNIAGAIGWCAFDYNTHLDFGSGDRICHHGVCDMFRLPKYAAGVYQAQCDPARQVVLEPAFKWSVGDIAGGGGVGRALINTNCERLRVYLGEEFIDELTPDFETYPGLEHPPVWLSEKLMSVWGAAWRPLRIEGWVGDQCVAQRTLSNRGEDRELIFKADDTQLHADGADATRVGFMVTDEHGNPQPFAVAALTFTLEGPATLVGDNPFPLIGGRGAVWIRAGLEPGKVNLIAKHPWLGERSLTIEIIP